MAKRLTASRSRTQKPAPPQPAAGGAEKPSAQTLDTFVVGVGASAGGLQALQSFFGALKDPLNAAFVVIQHLSPDFKSFMVELLAKHTKMPVQRAEHDVLVQPAHVYLIPPKTTLTIAGGRLQLVKTDPHRGLHLPIDQFFISMAADAQHRGVAVILSGTGSDGTAGIRAVKAAGGMVMVQSEDSAQFDGMPRSAIGTGLADYVLVPDKMPAQLAAYLNHPLLAQTREVGRRRGSDVESMLTEIFMLLRKQCGVDFSHYKPATIDRRIERRMSVCQIDNLPDYARHLAQSPREVGLLFNELLIGVTAFFRDRPAWETLEKEVLPNALKALAPGETVRGWVAGCSSGEEAYSLAILIAEELQRQNLHNPVKIFATDISKDSLAHAARGHYLPTEVAGLSAARLEKFFVQESTGFRTQSRLREMVVFANHNLLSDPPFTKLSLICCRNLLIYLNTPMQQRVLTLFSFALRDDGVLFLGSSESIGEATDRFQPIASRENLYRNRRVGHLPPMLINPARVTRGPAFDASAALQRATVRVTPGEVPSLDEVHRRITAEFTPSCIVIDNRDEVVHIVGNAGDFLRFPEGGFTRNVFKLTRHNLADALRSALIRAQQKGDRFTYDNVPLKTGRKSHLIRIHVRPMPDKNGKLTGSRLIFFESVKSAPGSEKGVQAARADSSTARRIVELEHDLSLTRESLQATVQDLETSNEEIQAANEELLAANEELQSTNEELQSVNEELHTVNVENQSRIEELSQLTNDINNLLANAAVGVLFIDADLRLRRASRSALVLLELTESDLGVPIETVARLLHAPDLPSIAEAVIRSNQPLEREMESPSGGRWLMMRCIPFRNEMGRTHGVVVTLIDITERQLSQRRLLAQAAMTQGVLDAMDASVAVLDRAGLIVHVNTNWRQFVGDDGLVGGKLDIGANYFDVCSQRESSSTAKATTSSCLDGMRRVLRGDASTFVRDYRSEEPAENRWYRFQVVALHSPEPGLAVAHFNITSLKNAEQVLGGKAPDHN